MKTLVFYMYMFFLLLGGGQYFYASTSPSNNLKSSFPKITRDKHSKHIYDDQGTNLIEDTDVDVEEEYLAGEECKQISENKFFYSKYSLQNTIYTSHLQQLLLNYYCTRFTISPIIGISTSPIYITLRVIRI